MNPNELRKAKLQQVLQNARQVRAQALKSKYAPKVEVEIEQEHQDGERPDPVGQAEPLSDEELKLLLQHVE